MRDLGRERLCAVFGLSRSALYRVFGPAGGVEAVIRRQRLVAAGAVLRGRRAVDIETVATRFGFTDASSFSRAFRREFGYPPSMARDADTDPFTAAGPCRPTGGTRCFFRHARSQ